MPSIEKHEEISRKRTGSNFHDLHTWIDEPQKDLGKNHRRERHTLDDIYINYVMEKWGVLGVLEFIHHIVEDYQDTENIYLKKILEDSKKHREEYFKRIDGQKVEAKKL